MTGYNEAFIIDSETRNKLIEASPKSAEIIRPILRGRDIKKYNAIWSGQYIINAHNGTREKNISPLNIDDYPAVKEHLDKYYYELEKRTDKGITPYHLRNCAYMEDFDREKIVWKIIGHQMAFFIDSDNFIVNNACYILTGKNLKYLLAILNSRVIKWYSYFTNMNKTGIGDMQVGAQNVNLFPVPVLLDAQQKPIVKLIETILKEKNNNIITRNMELQIEKIVYKLYDLTKEETDFIESNLK